MEIPITSHQLPSRGSLSSPPTTTFWGENRKGEGGQKIRNGVTETQKRRNHARINVERSETGEINFAGHVHRIVGTDAGSQEHARGEGSDVLPVPFLIRVRQYERYHVFLDTKRAKEDRGVGSRMLVPEDG